MDRLAIFDFDNTLFRSPENTDANRALYEKETGVPWIISKEMSRKLSLKHGRPINPRTGWWGKAETLMPPLVPDPAPPEFWIDESMQALQKCKADPETMTVVMTGRHSGLKAQVLRILHDGDFAIEKTPKKEGGWHYEWAEERIALYLLGMDGPCPKKVGPRPGDTLPWKLWVIEQYLQLYPELIMVEIWEDREEHVERFRKLHPNFEGEVVVHHIKGD